MTHRFRFLNARGAEVKVPSVDELVRLFRAGELTEETLLYDVVAREWCPARTHPACGFMLESEDEEAPDARVADAVDPVDVDPWAGTDVQEPGFDAEPASDSDTAARELPAGSFRVGPDLDPGTGDILGDLELIEDDAEDVTGTFLAARERERQEERMARGAVDDGLQLVGPAMDRLGYPLTPVPEVQEAERISGTAQAPEAGSDRPAPRPPQETRAGGGTPAPTGPRKAALPTPRSRRSSSIRATLTGSGISLLRQAALFVLLLAVGGWGIADAWSAPIPPPSPEEALIPATPPRPAGPLAAAPVTLVPEDALAQMAASMETLRASMRLGEPPAVWMAGPYLADAAAYPEVKRYWQRYADFVGRLRQEEERYYRAGLVEQLEAQGVYGSAQDIRAARAMQDFRADAPRRDAHYADMERLAVAALGLHGFLEGNTAAIRYDPVERGPTRDPVLEVGVGDAGVRGQLESRVDLLLEALDAVAGPDPERRRDVTRHVLGRIGARTVTAAD